MSEKSGHQNISNSIITLCDVARDNMLVDNAIKNILLAICKHVNRNCSDECPVYYQFNGIYRDSSDVNISINACICRENGAMMLNLIRTGKEKSDKITSSPEIVPDLNKLRENKGNAKKRSTEQTPL